MSILLGRGDGTFLPAVNYSVESLGGTAGFDPDAVTVADIDGHIDIVTANHDDSTVSVLVGNGDGTFQQPATTYPVHSADGTKGFIPRAVWVGQVNGHTDIITADQGDGTVSVLQQNPDGTFSIPVIYSVQGGSRTIGENPNSLGSLAVGQFNSDGFPDIVTANYGDDTVSVLLGKSDGTFQQPAATYAVGIGPYAVTVADVNQDNKLDIITANYGINTGGTLTASGNTISVLQGNGDGTFQAARSYSVGDFPDGVAVGQFNQDGIPDIVTANQGANTVSVLLGTGNGQFQQTTPATGVAIGNVPYLQDLDGDNIADALILDGSGNILFRHGLGGADEQFDPPVTINPGNPARDVTVYRTASGWAVAAIDAMDNAERGHPDGGSRSNLDLSQ